MTRRVPNLPLSAAFFAFAAVACGGAIEPSTSSTGSSSGASSSPGFSGSAGFPPGQGPGASGSSGGGSIASSGSTSGSTGGPAPSCVQGTPCADFFNGGAPGTFGGFGCGTLPYAGSCGTSCTCDSPTGYLQCTDLPCDADGGMEDAASSGSSTSAQDAAPSNGVTCSLQHETFGCNSPPSGSFLDTVETCSDGTTYSVSCTYGGGCTCLANGTSEASGIAFNPWGDCASWPPPGWYDLGFAACNFPPPMTP
jgi:hypothetical protein